MTTMYFSRRKRLDKLAADEALGKVVWTREFDGPARVRILHALRDYSQGYMPGALQRAHQNVLRDEGKFRLASGSGPVEDLLEYMTACPSEMFVTCTEALYDALLEEAKPEMTAFGYGTVGTRWMVKPQEFEATVNTVMREHRIGYEMMDGRFIEIDSQAMHAEVVKPTLRLLSSRKEYRPVEDAFAEALEQIAKGNAANAITDAARALQQMLVVAGCKGNTLGQLLAAARQRKLFGAHDYPLLDALERAISWVAADRTAMG